MVQEHLTATFRRYGLPEAFYIDNGSPWGDTSGARWTRLKVWLLKLGIRVVHARPCQPQGRGKNERFHRTLNAEGVCHALPSAPCRRSSAPSTPGAWSTTWSDLTKALI